MNYCILNHYQCIEVMGEKAAAFLQGQLTNNVMHDSPNLLCNIKGRIMAQIQVEHQQGKMYLLLQKNLWPKVFSLLEKPALLSKVSFRESFDNPIYGIIEDRQSLITLNATKISGLTEISYEKWHEMRLLQHQFELYPQTIGLFLPHDLGLETQWIDFKKGCYRGQEIIARMHYLGKSKVHLKLFTHPSFLHLHPGDSIEDQGIKVGEVVDKNTHLLLGCVKINHHFSDHD